MCFKRYRLGVAHYYDLSFVRSNAICHFTKGGLQGVINEILALPYVLG
jgi:hypothetical protein